MLDGWLPQDESSDGQALVTPNESIAWSALRQQIRARSQDFKPLDGKRVGLRLAAEATSITQLLSLIDREIHVFLIAADTPSRILSEWAADFGLSAILQPDGSETDFEQKSVDGTTGAITILTSGTTGKPKAVQHSWHSLVRPVRRFDDANHRPRWLLTYRPHLYAGLQVMMQCLLNRGTLAMPAPGANAEEVAILAAESNVEFASATPSYWRWLLTLAGDQHLSKIPLKQITLGGEAVDQATLDALKKQFPQTRLVHIYATTELGRCFSVTDGLAGFPSRFLEQPSSDGVEMKIEDGELIVRSANAMTGYDRSATTSPRESWFRTGDLVNIEADRVHFVGRKTDMINVGGNKVYPVEVENVIRSVPGVADTRVYSEPSSIVGELVKCDFVLEPGYAAEQVKQAMREKTIAELQSYQRPRFISVVDEIPRTAAGKADRS